MPVEVFAFFSGLVVGIVVAVTVLMVLKATHNRKIASPPSSGTFFELGWHSNYLCTPACVSPYGIVDNHRPIPGVWWCGISNKWEQCRGSKVIEGAGLGGYGKYGECCRHRQLDTGVCLLAGRATTIEEIRGGT